jgi:hypothetical protein
LTVEFIESISLEEVEALAARIGQALTDDGAAKQAGR